LRKAQGEGGGRRQPIETIPKRGYRFTGFLTEPAPAPGSAAEPRPMLLVLPFENFGGDKEQEYFIDGLTEEMITQLGRLNP
jgi:TolB-like protein